MYIYDTQKKKKVEFEPINKGEVKIYVCGPTVYDDSHLGHARSSIAFDLLRRVLIGLGYRVIFVKNFTDIDDKIVKKMQETKQSLKEITNFYINRYKEEMKALHVQDADIEPKATENLEFMIKDIQNLLDKGFAYEIEDGVYFDTTKDEKYLSLSSYHVEEAKSRVEKNEQKKDQKDFALWKKVSKEDIGFDSPFGYGRPGWHTECSSMIKRFLANEGKYQIDIHAGGADLLFPHHENEAAQTRCHSKQDLAKYWMHNGFVAINGEKMSKSLGNSFFLKDALEKYDGEILRFYLISTHYRADFNFSEEDLLASKKRLDKLYRLKKRLKKPKKFAPNKTFKTSLLEALSDDLNISKALSIVDEMISKSNELLDLNPKDKSVNFEIHANLELVKNLIGIGYMDKNLYFQFGFSDLEKEKINSLIKQRADAKKQKDFALADKLRDELQSLHVNIQDTSDGTIWERSEG